MGTLCADKNAPTGFVTWILPSNDHFRYLFICQEKFLSTVLYSFLIFVNIRYLVGICFYLGILFFPKCSLILIGSYYVNWKYIHLLCLAADSMCMWMIIYRTREDLVSLSNNKYKSSVLDKYMIIGIHFSWKKAIKKRLFISIIIITRLI